MPCHSPLRPKRRHVNFQYKQMGFGVWAWGLWGLGLGLGGWDLWLRVKGLRVGYWPYRPASYIDARTLLYLAVSKGGAVFAVLKMGGVEVST